MNTKQAPTSRLCDDEDNTEMCTRRIRREMRRTDSGGIEYYFTREKAANLPLYGDSVQIN
jgi:guanylate kinase